MDPRGLLSFQSCNPVTRYHVYAFIRAILNTGLD